MNSAIAFPNASALELILFMLLVLFINALFVLGETAADLLKPMHVKHLRDKNDAQADRLQEIVDKSLTFVAACRLGSDLSRLLLFVIVLALAPGAMDAFGITITYPTVVATAFLLMLPVGLINLVFELVPRSYASLHPLGTTLRLSGFMRIAKFLFSLPATMVTALADRKSTRLNSSHSQISYAVFCL